MKKVLAFCDSPVTHAGFARVARNLFSRWPIAADQLDVWAINFNGWGYERSPWQLYPAGSGTQPWWHPERLRRFLDLLNTGRYSHLWLLQDAFGFPPEFCEVLRQVAITKGVRVMAYVPVDAPWEPEWTAILRAADVAATYTEYGKAEICKALEVGRATLGDGKDRALSSLHPLSSPLPIHVIPHGVDACFTPGTADRAALRAQIWNPKFVGPDDFLLLMVAMHQRRKDVTRALEILAGLRERGVPAKLALHMGRFSDANEELGVDLECVGRQLGLVHGRDFVHHHGLITAGLGGLSDGQLADLYRAADCFLTTTLGEGWGLPITEALACGCPVAVPEHTACREIVGTLRGHGMHPDRAVLLAAADLAPALDFDHSRLRRRVCRRDAVIDLQRYHMDGAWRDRPALPAAGAQWLDWQRIADTHWRLLKGDR